ncbi:MAG: hypothetical protein ACRER4_03095 [Steroidobacteraceae bacterium]
MRSLGYHTGFLHGGYGYFDSMNHFLAGNGFEALDRKAIPFFPIIMTTSNHQPFTFHPGLEKIGIPEPDGGR